MKILLLFGIVTLTMANADPPAWGISTPPQRPVNPIIRGENKFSPVLFQLIAEGKSGNLVCSTLSVFLALSMMAQGTVGYTSQYMDYILGFTNRDYSNLLRIHNVINGLNNYHKVELRVVNRIFVNKNFKIKDKFSTDTELFFHSKSENLDFSDSIKASETVNKWCTAQTNNRIKDLVTPADFSPDKVLILLNAVYFKGTWKTKFDVRDTEMRSFTTVSGVVKSVPTMYVWGKFNYGVLRSLNARFVELPYKSQDSTDTLSMFIILPDQRDGLAELEKKLHQVTLKSLIGARREREVRVFLPKFKIESKINLKNTINALGLTRIFGSSGELAGINDDPSLYVSSIGQKAFIEVNEEGSEAAAVTNVVFAVRSDDSLYFTADRPFIAIIATTNDESGVHLFSARYTGPDN